MRVIPELKEIRQRRKRAGLSQAELSAMVGISQPHMAKIEKSKVDPSYGLVSRIFEALDATISDECWQYMSKDMMIARKGDKVEVIAPMMKEKGFSQVPVFDGGEPIGMLTEHRIIGAQQAVSYHSCGGGRCGCCGGPQGGLISCRCSPGQRIRCRPGS